MAGILNAQYQPFSFEERLKPLMMAQEEHNKVQEALASLDDASGAYKHLINPNSKAGQTVQKYRDTLNSVVDNLNTNGLSSVNRNTLMELKKQYNSEINGINEAAKKLGVLQDTVNTAKMKDNTLLVGHMPTIDEMVANPASSPYMVSGASLKAQGMAAGKALSDQRANMSISASNALTGYAQVVQTKGYNSKEAAMMRANLSSFPEVQAAIENMAKMNGIDNLSEQYRQTAFDTLLEGTLEGLTYDANYNFIQQRDWNPNSDLGLDLNNYGFDNPFDKEDTFQQDKTVDKGEEYRKYKNFFNDDGSYTEFALTYLNSSPALKGKGIPAEATSNEKIKNEILQYKKELDASGKTFKEYALRNNTGTDALRDTSYLFRYRKEDTKDLLSTVSTHNGKYETYIYDMSTGNEVQNSKRKYVKPSDINTDEGITIVNRGNKLYYKVHTKDGDSVLIKPDETEKWRMAELSLAGINSASKTFKDYKERLLENIGITEEQLNQEANRRNQNADRTLTDILLANGMNQEAMALIWNHNKYISSLSSADEAIRNYTTTAKQIEI